MLTVFRTCSSVRSLLRYSAKYFSDSGKIKTTSSDSPSLNDLADKLDIPKISEHNVVTEESLSCIVGDKAFYELPVLHINVKKNNAFALLSDCNGRILAHTSCGMEGFRNAQKNTTVAAQTTGISIGLKAQKLGISRVRVKLRGMGFNRASILSGMSLSGLQMVSLTDDTKLHYGRGKRPKKMRRM